MEEGRLGQSATSGLERSSGSLGLEIPRQYQHVVLDNSITYGEFRAWCSRFPYLLDKG
jgi:hypothetical protein